MKNFHPISIKHFRGAIFFSFLTLGLMLSSGLKAQLNYLSSGYDGSGPFIYFDASVGAAGRAKGGGTFAGIGGNVIIIRHWGLHVGYTTGNQSSEQEPEEYHGTMTKLGEVPGDRFKETSLRVVKIIPLNSPRIRFKAELGVANLQYQTIHYSPYVVTNTTTTLLGAILDAFNNSNNYTSVTQTTYYHISYSRNTSLGLSTRIAAEFPVARVFGMYVAIRGTLTPTHSFVGLETGFSLGRVRDAIDQ